MTSAITISFVIVVLAILFYWNTRPINSTAEEVKRVLVSWLENKLDRGEWDSFQSLKIKNAELESIRLQCMDIYHFESKYLCEPKIEGRLNSDGKEKVKGLIGLVERLEGNSGKINT